MATGSTYRRACAAVFNGVGVGISACIRVGSIRV